MSKLFKNARIVDVENGDVFDADILVENGNIKSFEKCESFDGEIVDLEGNFVLPAFVNAFMDSFEAGKVNFREDFNKNDKENLKKLFLIKNLLAGAVFFNDISATNVPVLENLEEKSEKELSSLSMEVAKSGKRIFVKLGQDLQSLGSIDKKFGKNAPLVLEDFGFLDRGATIVGANCLEKDDFEVLEGYESNFVVLPNEDGKVGRRQTNIVSLLKRGQNVCIGSGNSSEIDFFGFMRQMISSMRSMFEDESVIDEREALKIATNGAVLGFDNRLEVGSMATFLVVCARESLYDDIFKTLVWERSKNDVLMSVKDGDVLQKNGEIFMKNMPSYATIISGLKP